MTTIYIKKYEESIIKHIIKTIATSWTTCSSKIIWFKEQYMRNM